MKITLSGAETRMVNGRTSKNARSLLYSEMNQMPSDRIDSLPVLYIREVPSSGIGPEAGNPE
jgi:hypothetical protein